MYWAAKEFGWTPDQLIKVSWNDIQNLVKEHNKSIRKNIANSKKQNRNAKRRR